MLPFVGPSYSLATRRADIQRAVNLYLVGMETPNKAPFIMDSVPGLILLVSLGSEIRGTYSTGSRGFVVAGSTLYEVHSNWSYTSRGTLASSTGTVDMAHGLSQLVIVDGSAGYVLRLSSNGFETITSEAFNGSTRVAFLDNYFVFTTPGTQQYQITAINDATTIDALDFASAESNPDNIVCHLVVQDDLVLFGEVSTEFHFNSGASDYPFEKARGIGFPIGCAAAHSAQTIDTTAFWIGKDENGSGIVYKLEGRQPRRISTTAVEQALQGSTDISEATAYCYQRHGLTFYCLNAPGLSSTWCYEVSTGQWHERCDLDADGQFEPHRATCHMFVFGAHLVGDADGKLYELDSDTYTNAGDPLVRERISPHSAAPGLVNVFYNRFVLHCTTGEAPQGVDPYVELSYSNDSGATWGSPILRSLGKVGERFARVVWNRLGMSRDRVWKTRFSGNAPFSIVGADVDTTKGNN